MTEPDASGQPVTPRLRRLFVDHLAYPILYAIPASVLMTGFLFFLAWAGWRGKFKPWGDPITFMEALSKMPKMLAVTFVISVVIFSLARVHVPEQRQDWPGTLPL